MGEGENATRKRARVRAHTCQPGGEAMGTCWDQERGEMGMAAGERWAETGTNSTWIQERGGMGMAKYEGQGKNATRKITWSDGEVWMR